MAYLPGERETVFNYDELEDTWIFETSVRRHITKIEKRIKLYDILSEEIDERGRRVYLRVKMKNGTVSPFCKTSKKEIVIKSILRHRRVSRTHF